MSRNSGGFSRQVGAMRIALGAALVAFVLAGCGESKLGTLFYLRPYGIENQTCDQLKANGDAQGGAAKQKAELRDKAGTDPIGSVIGSVVYGPDQNKALWTQRQHEEEAARRNCSTPAPPPSPPPK